MSNEQIDTVEQYDNIISECREIMISKNHDYGAAWREMRMTSITDQILVKIRRIQTLEELEATGKEPKVSEGIRSEYRDILNYCAFAMIKLDRH